VSITIAFNTANLVAHYSDYRFELKNWGHQHQLAVERTGVEEWIDICDRIRTAGYRAIEVWVALVQKCGNDDARAERFRRIMLDHDLRPVALAGALNHVNGRLCQMLGIPAACGGYWGSDKSIADRVMRESGVLFNYENHQEKSVEEIRDMIDGGENGFAIAVDTGWLGTQGMHAPEAIRKLGRLVRHVHLKDVVSAGGHATVQLGTGCCDIPNCLRELKAIGFDGVLSWEDVPENRNPFEIALETREYIEREWSRS
jgi:sugar phosphate isomerase/epimerase